MGAPQEEIPIRSLHVWHRNSVDDWCRCVELANVWSNAKTKTSGVYKGITVVRSGHDSLLLQYHRYFA